MKAVILAGGFGTRLKSVVGDVPKPMASIAGKPFLEHQIRFLRRYGVKEIIIAVHHMADMIKSYFGTGHRWEVNITYSEEDVPLGTAGAIKNAEKYIDNTFIVMNGDSHSNFNLDKFIEFHRLKRSTSSLLLTRTNDPSHFGSVVIFEDKIMEFRERGTGGESMINAGVYLFEPKIFDYIDKDKNVSLEKDVFPKLIRDGQLCGVEHGGYFIDIGRPETYAKFKQDVLRNMTLRERDKVRDAMNRISKNGVDLVLITDDNMKLLGVINDKLAKKHMLAGGNIDDPLNVAMVRDIKVAKTNDSKDKVFEILRSGYRHLPIVDEQGRLSDVEFNVAKVKTETFPTVRGRAPLRISFAGGGTDLPYFFEKYGGVVINSTINKYCHATIVKRADSKIHINSEIWDELIINSPEEIAYDGKYDMIKAVIKIMKPDFGFELYLHNDIPPGRGLGSSATISVLIIKLLSHLMDLSFDDYKIAELAFKAEREELKIKGGWQDQYAAITGGFNFMEFNQDKNIIYPLKLKEGVINELDSRMLLCYVGKSHHSGEVHGEHQKDFESNEEKVTEGMKELKRIAIEMKDALLTNSLDDVGKLLHESWNKKREIFGSISNDNIDRLYEIGTKNGAYGGKLLGAGDGGYILFFYSPQKRNKLAKALSDAGGEVVNFNFEFEGTKIWTPTSKF